MRLFEEFQLNLDSTLRVLPAFDYSVDRSTPIPEIVDAIESNKSLPGVLVLSESEPWAVLSRERLLEKLSGRFGFAVYERRSIGDMVNSGSNTPLVFDADTTIAHAAQEALRRSAEQAFSPIVVQLAPRQFGLIQANVLLLAQSQLLSLANQEIEKQRAAAVDANETKGQFLANISHEIRTPMNGVIGMTQLLLETKLDPKQHEYLTMIKSSGDWLLNVINDVLDFSKIEAKRLELQPVEFDLRRFAAETIEPLKMLAADKQNTIHYSIDPSLPRVLIGDTVRIRQMLVNLIGNAIKFTDTGAIDICFDKVSHSNDQLGMAVSVQDTGIGISAQRLDSIFNAFEQADGSTTRRFGGTGLGLSICKLLAELMGGTVAVQSTEGVGSKFTFTIQVAVSSQTELADYAASSLAESSPVAPATGLRILMAEDNLINQRLAKALLDKHDHEVTIVDNGKDAVERVTHVSFDLILMDAQMPIMDGVEAIRLIRKLPAPKNEIPILALTAHAMAGDREKFLSLGADGYLSKPIDPDAFFGEINRLTAKSFSLPTEAQSEPSSSSQEPAEPDVKIDWSKALQTAAGHQSILVSMVEAFLEDAPQTLSRIDVAIDKNDFAQFKISTHSLKNSFAYFGIHAAADKAFEMEQMGTELLDNANSGVKTSFDRDAIGRAREEVSHYWETTRGQLLKFLQSEGCGVSQ